MTDISKNWYDLSVNSNILKQSYIDGFIDVSNNIVGRENLWVENEKNVGDTRFGLGTLDPSISIDAMNNNPIIRITNTSLNTNTQTNTNLGQIEFVSPIYRQATGSGYQTSGSIHCENLYNEYNYNGSLVMSTGGGTSNATNNMTIRGNDGFIGVGTDNPTSLLEVDGDILTVTDINQNTQGSLSGLGIMPIGMIIMYYGSMDGKSPNTKLEGTLDNWKICDGTNYSQYNITTPNLSNRFIRGSDSYTIGDTGGADSHALTWNEMAGHSHGGSVTSSANHRHTPQVGRGDDNHYGSYAMGADDIPGGLYASVDQTSSSGQHTHTMYDTGGVYVSNQWVTQPHENRPSYYALAYIMRVY